MQLKNNRDEDSFFQKEVKKKEISLTAYRAYFIFKLLLNSSLSKDEILSRFQTDRILSGTCHKDSLVNSINTLRASGCEIEKPRTANNFKYRITAHPFKIKMTETQSEILNFIRKSLYSRDDYKLIVRVNNLYNVLENMIADKKYIERLENSNYFRNVNIKILSNLIKYCKEKAVITINYVSPVNDTEEIKVKCEKVFFENKRLYLWGWSYKYNHTSYHRIDKIISVSKTRSSNSDDPEVLSTIVRYKLSGEAIQMFVPTPEEKMIEHNKSEIIVENNVINKFNFFQRAAGFAGDCVILSPEEMRQDYVEGLNKILEVYHNE